MPHEALADPRVTERSDSSFMVKHAGVEFRVHHTAYDWTVFGPDGEIAFLDGEFAAGYPNAGRAVRAVLMSRSV